jgi:hypothetical protein
MQAHVGDRIVIESEKVGQKTRDGEILEVIESVHGAHYRVRWDDGHESDIRPAAGSARIFPADLPKAAPKA